MWLSGTDPLFLQDQQRAAACWKACGKPVGGLWM